MQHSFKSMIGMLLGIAFFAQSAFADIEQITTSQTRCTFSKTEWVPVFKDRGNRIKIQGAWLDITNKVTCVGLQGQANFDLGIVAKSSSGASPAFIEVNLNMVGSARTGRFRLETFRNGRAGAESFNIEIIDDIRLSALSVLTMNNTPFPNNDIPVGTEFKLRCIGVGMNNFKYVSTSAAIEILDFSMPGATNTQEDVKLKAKRKTTSFEVVPREFVYGLAGSDKNAMCILGVGATLTGSMLNFQITAPVLAIQNILGIYNRRSASCNYGASTFLSIVDPLRCKAESGGSLPVPAPQVGGPSTNAVVTMPPIQFEIKNTGNAPSPAGVLAKVYLPGGINEVLTRQTLPIIAAGATVTITFARPESRKTLSRNPSCADCYDISSGPFNWNDPSYELRIDPTNEFGLAVTKSFPGTVNDRP